MRATRHPGTDIPAFGGTRRPRPAITVGQLGFVDAVPE
jgi:hypothetical protein